MTPYQYQSHNLLFLIVLTIFYSLYSEDTISKCVSIAILLLRFEDSRYRFVIIMEFYFLLTITTLPTGLPSTLLAKVSPLATSCDPADKAEKCYTGIVTYQNFHLQYYKNPCQSTRPDIFQYHHSCHAIPK